MKQKHTPGPWVCHSGMVWKDGPDVLPKGDNDGIPIARMDRDTPETRPTERDANARLIAAAPELLSNLENLLAAIEAGVRTQTMIECAGKENSYIGQARAAIAKAKE